MKVLMICSGNTCRSPMAEGIFKHLLSQQGMEDVKVSSMGLGAYDGESPTAHAIQAMKEIDIDISENRSRRVMLPDLMETDRFYVMTQSHKNILTDAVPELDGKIKVLDIPDPYGRDLDVYRECRDQMMEYFQQELAHFGEEA